MTAAMFGIGGTGANAATADVDQLFQDAKAQAEVLARDTDQMETFTNSDVSWESHADEVNLIRSHLNKLGEIVSQLQTARDDADKRHQEVINRILPPLQELASNTAAIIEHLNRYQGDLQDPAYQEYLKQNDELANNILQEVSATVAYDNSKDKMEKLQKKLARL